MFFLPLAVSHVTVSCTEIVKKMHISRGSTTVQCSKGQHGSAYGKGMGQIRIWAAGMNSESRMHGHAPQPIARLFWVLYHTIIKTSIPMGPLLRVWFSTLLQPFYTGASWGVKNQKLSLESLWNAPGKGASEAHLVCVYLRHVNGSMPHCNPREPAVTVQLTMSLVLHEAG